MSDCPHVASVNTVRSGIPVHKDECCQCYDGPDPTLAAKNASVDTCCSSLNITCLPSTGLNICLTCFSSGCNGIHKHCQRHYEASKHAVVLNVLKHHQSPAEASSEPDSLLALGLASGEITAAFSFSYRAFCLACDVELSMDSSVYPQLQAAVQAIEAAPASHHIPALNMADVEEKPEPCPHTVTISQNQRDVAASLASSGALAAHTGTLSEIGLPVMVHDGQGKCAHCDIAQNLWLCLHCGELGCARRDYDGSGGNNHAAEHHQRTKHAVVYKLGTASGDGGSADLWCYQCNKAVLDEDLPQHLRGVGIDVRTATKTAMSLAELQLQRNKEAQFSSAFNPLGQELALLFGPRLCGVANTGNTCYIAAPLQCLLALPAWRRRFGKGGLAHLQTCRNNRPGQCWECQLSKLAVALCSGEYSMPPAADVLLAYARKHLAARDANAHADAAIATATAAHTHTQQAAAASTPAAQGDEGDASVAKRPRREDNGDTATSLAGDAATTAAVDAAGQHTSATPVTLQPGVTVRDLKKVFCGSHALFSGTQQQCAYEFLGYFLDALKQRMGASAGNEPALAQLAFTGATKVQCAECMRVRFKYEAAGDVSVPVPAEEQEGSGVTVEACLSEWSQTQVIEGFNCPHCRTRTTAFATAAFATFPDVLVMHMRRYVVDTTTWTARKLAHAVHLPLADDGVPQLDLGWLRVQHDEDEELLPEEEAAAAAANPAEDGLMEIAGCSRALAAHALRVNRGNPDAALEWLFNNPDAQPAPAPAPAAALPLHDDRPAVYRLRSCVVHMGATAHAGHYTAFVRMDAPDADTDLSTAPPASYRASQYQQQGLQTVSAPGWVCFNDNKVFQSEQPAYDTGYVLFFERVQQ